MSDPEYHTVELDGLQVTVYRSHDDNKLVVDIEGPRDPDTLDTDEPAIRIWLNEALIYREGEYPVVDG